MIQDNQLNNRHVLPRWTTINQSHKAGELANPPKSKDSVVRVDAHKRSSISLIEELDKRRDAWRISRDIGSSEELITTAIVAGQTDDDCVREAAEFILADGSSGRAVLAFSEGLLDKRSNISVTDIFGDAAEMHTAITRRKRLLAINPRDAMLATETALLHANLGQVDSSEKLLRRALALAGNSRYVVRAAARFFCHVKRPDEALAILRASPRLSSDPWLRSAEMAVSAISESEDFRWRKSIDLLKDEDFSLHDRSELAAEVATFELQAGGRKRAIKAAEISVSQPTENAVAQIEYLKRIGEFGDDTIPIDISRSMEAAAQNEYAKWDFSAALKACESWQSIEPFSIRPAVFGTYLSTTSTADMESGLTIGLRGLVGNPNDPILLNNIAVLYAYRGDVDLATEYSVKSKINLGKERDISGLATEGLIQFRKGMHAEGMRSYEAAIDNAALSNNYSQALRAYTFYAREVSAIDPSLALDFIGESDKIFDRYKKVNITIPRDVLIMKNRLEKETIVNRLAELTFRPMPLEIDNIEKLVV